MSNIEKPITQSDIDRFERKIKTKGKKGVDEVYEEMTARGYGSAYWAKHEYAGHTDYGLSNISQIEKQNRKFEKRQELEDLYINTAQESLKRMSKIIQGEDSKTLNRDIQYKEFKEIRENAYEKSGLKKETVSFLESDFEINKSKYGEKYAEDKFNEIINPSDINFQKLREEAAILSKKLIEENNKNKITNNIELVSNEDYIFSNMVNFKYQQNEIKVVDEVIKKSTEIVVNKPVSSSGKMAKNLDEAEKNLKDAQDLTLEKYKKGELTEWQKSWLKAYDALNPSSVLL